MVCSSARDTSNQFGVACVVSTSVGRSFFCGMDKYSQSFWEGRFNSQALFNETALLVCMACVYHNAIRAILTKMPEASSRTSIKRRCEAVKIEGGVSGVVAIQTCRLERVVGYVRASMPADFFGAMTMRIKLE